MRAQLRTTLLSTLAMGAVLALGAGPVRADDTAAEIRALKAQLRALERKVASQEQSQRRTQAAVARVATAGHGPGVMYSKGGPIVVPSLCPDGTFSFKSICITPGGFLAMETVFRERSQGGGLPSNYGAIPYNSSRLAHVNETRFSAQQSRFSLLAQGKVNPTLVLTGYAEVDFLGAAQSANFNESNSFNPRIRHLYATVDKTDWGFSFLAGQNWSLVTMNGVGIEPRKEVTPLTIDPQYVPGFAWARQAQLRATQRFGDFAVAVSAESASTTGFPTTPAAAQNGALGGTLGVCGNGNAAANGQVTGGTQNLNGCNNLSFNHIPDFVGKVAYDPSFFGRPVHVEGFGVLRDFYDRTGLTGAIPVGGTGGAANTGIVNGANHDVFGGGVGGSVLVSAIPKILDLQFSAATGQGLGRYGTSQLADVAVNANGTLKPVGETMFLAGATLHWGSFDIYGYAGQEEINRTIPFGGTAIGSVTQNNFGCNVEGSGLCTSTTRRVRQITAGIWDNVYKGSFGLLKAGVQYSYTERTGFSGVNGVAPTGSDNVVYTSLRYYPF